MHTQKTLQGLPITFDCHINSHNHYCPVWGSLRLTPTNWTKHPSCYHKWICVNSCMCFSHKCTMICMSEFRKQERKCRNLQLSLEGLNQGQRTWGAEGAIVPPLCKVGGRASLPFTMFNMLLLINSNKWYFIKSCLFNADFSQYKYLILAGCTNHDY